MANIITYIRKFQFSFEEKPLNDLDALVFSWLTYMYYPQDVVKRLNKEKIKIKDLFPEENLTLATKGIFGEKESIDFLKALVISNRFKEVEAFKFINKIVKSKEEQFGAITFFYKKKFIFVGLRGTDTSLTGWKEDFNLSYIYPVPSQSAALRYLESIAKAFKGKIYVGGHSKGGNLAAYAVVCAKEKTRKRIKKIYSFDGPGFLDEYYNSNKFKKSKHKIRKFVPYFCVFGIIMDYVKDIKIIKSNGFLIFQHNALYWLVDIKNTSFVFIDKIDKNALAFNKGIKQIFKECNREERHMFVDDLFNILNKAEIEDPNDLILKLPQIILEAHKLTGRHKEVFTEIFSFFIKPIFSFNEAKKDHDLINNKA